MSRQKRSWVYASWDAVEKANLEDAARMSFTQKIEWLESTSRTVKELKPVNKQSVRERGSFS